MRVTKRDGSTEDVQFDKITRRLAKLCWDLTDAVDVSRVAAAVCSSIHEGISTTRLDELTSEVAQSLATEHPDYGVLAARVLVSNLQKNTRAGVQDAFGQMGGIASPGFLECVERNAAALDAMIDFQRDYVADYFGFRTMERMYLTRVNGHIVERPQHLYMRVAVALWGDDLRRVQETYDALSLRKFTHASPTLFNAGMKVPQLASCFLISVEDDSIEGIFDAITKCAKISKYGGGIGLAVQKVRGQGAPIRGTNGTSDGLVPMLRVVNSVANYVNQCFAPGTKVYTRDRGVQRMDGITGDDFLCTRDGTWKRVNEVIVNQADDVEVLHLSVKHALESVTVTPVHEIFALRGQKKMTNHDVIRARLDSGRVAPAFVPAGDLTTDDMMVFPIPRDVADVNETEDWLRMYGIILGDGYLCTGRTEAGVCLGTERKGATIEFVKDFLTSRRVHFWTTPGNGCVSIRWTMNADTWFIPRNEVYAPDDGEKRVHPRFLNMPDRKVAALLRGLLETDGSLLSEFYFGSTSPHLADAVRFMCLRIGILTAGHVCDAVGSSHETSRGDTVTARKLYYVLRIPKHPVLWELGAVPDGLDCSPSEGLRFLRWNDMLFTRITGVESKRYSGALYDFNMDCNHNYLTDVGLVHNSGKRKGAIAAYLEPHHPDVFEFVQLRRNQGEDHLRARELFLGLWVPDIFMRRVEANASWSLLDPDACPGLADAWGADYDALYETYEMQGKAVRTLPAQDLWFEILRSQIETGVPYLLFKDAANAKSNQQHLGTIHCSNLCSEIIEYTCADEIAVCNLASMSLPAFVVDGAFDFAGLHAAVKIVARNLDRVIDVNAYPVEEAERSNVRHRPVGIGIQGLQDVFFDLRVPFDSPAARDLNRKIFEYMYHAALEASCEAAAELGPHPSHAGSPASQGRLQYHLWGVSPTATADELDWAALEASIARDGLRNSLLIAPMPTASTSQLLGNTEAMEPITSNLYSRRTLAGEFAVLNRRLVRDLLDRGVWTTDLKNQIVARDGSVQGLVEVPADLQALYKTAWELPMKALIDLAADRGPFVCQSQSLNLFIAEPNFKKLSSMHFYAWRRGLKTGCYYLRTKPASRAVQVTVNMPDPCVSCSG